MRDKRFVSELRGGTLKKDQHQQLMLWGYKCAENVLNLYDKEIDDRLMDALKVAKKWMKGNASVGDARNASLEAHSVARESSDSTLIAIARSVGHAVATAHMADHSLGAALYALKAVRSTGKSVEIERKWQNDQLPVDLKDLVITARNKKEMALKI